MNFKKLAGLLAGILLVAGVKISHAAESFGSVSLTVTVGSVDELAISLRTEGTTDWVSVATTTFGTGAVAFGASTVTIAGVQVRNDSPGINIKLGLSGFDSGVGVVGDPGYWSIGTAATQDVFAVHALFNGDANRPSVAAFNTGSNNIYTPDTPDTNDPNAACLAVSPQPTCEYVASGTNPFPDYIYAVDNGGNAHFAGTQNAGNIPSGQYRTAWFRFDAPSSTSVGGVGTRGVTVGVMGNLP